MRWLVVLVVCGACEKTPPPVDRDALWQLAPDHAVLAVVVAPGALVRLEDGFVAARAVLARAPDLAAYDREVTALETKLRGPLSLEAIGIDARGGAAVFVVDDWEPIVILPVVDRGIFARVTSGTRRGELDLIDTFTCKIVHRVYACARKPALLERLGKGRVSTLLARIGVRGEIEAVVSPPRALAAAASVQLARGAATLHAVAERSPDVTLANAKPRVEPDHTAGFVVLDIGQWLATRGVPASKGPVVEDVTLDALVASFAGPLTLTASANTLDAWLPLRDGAAAQKLVAHCDQVTPLLTVRGKRCRIALAQLDLDGWVEGNMLRVGQPGVAAAVTSSLSPAAQVLASGDWAIAIFGRGTLFAPSLAGISAVVSSDPTALRILTLFNELGVGIRVDGELVRGFATVRTIWANPDDVIAKLTALDPRVATADDGLLGKSIADASPTSPFAGDYRAGMLGLAVPLVLMGVTQDRALTAARDYLKW